MIVDFLLEGLEEFIFGAGLSGTIEPVGCAGWCDKGADHAAFDHPVEVSGPRLENGGLDQFILVGFRLILGKDGESEK